MQTLSPPTPRRICPYWAECNTRDMQSGPLGPQPGSESLAVITSAPGRGVVLSSWVTAGRVVSKVFRNVQKLALHGLCSNFIHTDRERKVFKWNCRIISLSANIY